MSGDKIDAQGSQGFINNPESSVSQQYGDRTDISSSDGGDVALRDIDKRIININIITGSSSNQPQSHLIAEVSKILGGELDLDAAIASAYQGALPPDANLHPVQTNDKISELADRRVLHKFIEILANDHTVSESTRAELQKIISSSDEKTTNDRSETLNQSKLISYLIVVLRPEPNQQFCVNAWLIPDDSITSLSKFRPLDITEVKKGFMCSLIEFPIVVKDLLHRSVKYLFGKDYELTIEFFLPIDYLSTEVDRFEVIPDAIDCDEFNPLGTHYKVSVRSYERLDTTYLYHHLQQWRSNWDRTTKSLKSVPSLELFENLTTMDCCNWKKLAFDLKEKLGIKITCVSLESDRKNLFKAILKSATPIAIWLRKEMGQHNCESELNRLLSIGDLEKLPEYIRKEREEAYICDIPEEHFGHHLVLLWEDPNRLTPDVMAHLLPSGQ